MFLEAIPLTTIYGENNSYVSFNRLTRNFPGRSEKDGEKLYLRWTVSLPKIYGPYRGVSSGR
jgi:hypothetical protein